MWKEKSKERLERYKGILKDSPLFFEAAQEAKQAEAALKAAAWDKKKEYTDDETAADVSYYCLAPALCSYVLWVLDRAMESGVKRLYFLARDAYFMYRTAKMFCSAFNFPVDCRYLSCSRYSVRIPMYHLDLDEALGYICRGGIDVTTAKILNRAGLSKKEREEVFAGLRAGGFSYGPDDPVPYAELENIKKILKECPLFVGYLTENSKKAMPLLEGYLKQEGLSDDVPMALVDSGWVGSMQKVLNRALDYIKEKQPGETKKTAPLEGYYWGLYELPEGVDPESYHCYYFSPGYNIVQKIYFSNCLFEAVFSAPHGMTMGYSKENGRYFPVYGEIPKAQKAFMEENDMRFCAFADKFILKAKENFSGGAFSGREASRNMETVYRLLRCFMGNPCLREAEVFGRLHFSDDVLDYKSQELAADLSEEELTANHAVNKILSMLGIKRGFLRESAWYEASAVLGQKNVRRHLRGYAGYKRLLYMRKQRQWRKIYG